MLCNMTGRSPEKRPLLCNPIESIRNLFLPCLLHTFLQFLSALHCAVPYFATAALKTCVLKNPPFVLSMTCWYTDGGGWFISTVPAL